MGDLVRARQHATTALAAARATAEFSAPMYLTYLGAVALAEGDVAEAQRHYQSALDEGHATDFMLPIGLALDGLARVARERGDTAQARASYEEALNVLRAIGDMPPLAHTLVALAQLALEDGDRTRANARFREALELARILGHRESLVAALEGIALALAGSAPARHECAERALRLQGAAERLRSGTHLSAPESAGKARELVRVYVAAQRAEALLAEGRRLSPEQAVAQARAALDEIEQTMASASDIHGLTPREREVVALVGSGYSNQHIAETLVIGRRTAEMHVSNLLSKLGMSSRAQLAVWAVEEGLVERKPDSAASGQPSASKPRTGTSVSTVSR